MEKREGSGCVEFYLGNNGKVTYRTLYRIDEIARKNVKLENGGRVMVKVGWGGSELRSKWMLYMNGMSSSYKLRRVVEVYDGISDENNRMVCVQTKPNIHTIKVRGVQIGDILGKVYSIVEEEKVLKEGIGESLRLKVIIYITGAG